MTDAPGVLQSLGVRELRILRAFLADEPICRRHPSYSECGCDGGSRVPEGWADRSEACCIEHDDLRTGLSLEQREALLGWLMAQYADDPRGPLALMPPGLELDESEA